MGYKGLVSCTRRPLYGLQGILVLNKTVYQHIGYNYYQLFDVSDEEKRLFFDFTISSVAGAGTGVVEGVRLPLRCLRRGVSKLKRYEKISESSSGIYRNVFSLFIGTTSQCLVRFRNTR